MVEVRPRCRKPRLSDAAERGSGTVLAAALVAVLVSIMVAALMLASAVAASTRASAAADLASLAAAGQVVAGAGQPQACSAAAAVVTRHQARLSGCRVSGLRVEIRVSAAPAFGLPPAHARAWAGTPE